MAARDWPNWTENDAGVAHHDRCPATGFLDSGRACCGEPHHCYVLKNVADAERAKLEELVRPEVIDQIEAAEDDHFVGTLRAEAKRYEPDLRRMAEDGG